MSTTAVWEHVLAQPKHMALWESGLQMCHALTMQSSWLTAKSMSQAIKPVRPDAIRQACEVKTTGGEIKAWHATLPLHHDWFLYS